jgi:predicted TIM-barrel fold metal-dependent hydrolase
VGVFFRGIEGTRTLDDPYFYPIYEEAQALDLPITIHTGAGCPAFTAVMDIDRNTSFPALRSLPIFAFRDLVHHRIPEQFPRLRFGFIEAGATWVPYVLHNLRRQFHVADDRWGPRYFADSRIFIACEANEDIPYLMQYIGEDNLIIGSDYGHNDPSEERELVKAMHERGDLAPRVLDKIFGANPARLYGL